MSAIIALDDYISADKVCQRLTVLKKLDEEFSKINAEFAQKFIERARSRGISSEQISQILDTTLNVIRSHGFSPKGSGVCFDTDDWSASLRFMVACTSEQRVVLGASIATAIVSEFENDLSDLISFGVMAPTGRLDACTP